jgi:hypothetical protein
VFRDARLALAVAVVLALIGSGSASASLLDADGNGIEDAAELPLARRFAPILRLHAGETIEHGLTVPLYPVPVEIMGLGGAIPGEGLTADRLFVVWRAQPLNYPYGDHWVHAAGWTPPLPESNPDCDYAGLRDEPPAYRQVTPPQMPSGPYTLRFHWEYGSPAADEPDEWYAVWEEGNAWSRRGAVFPPTVYAHLVRCQEAGCPPPFDPGAVLIQYWFFFPFNDWVNNHEGDWEGIQVITSSAHPATATLKDVEYFAHRVHITRDAAVPLADHCLIEEDTHPVAFTGGHGEVTGCIGGAGRGEGSHGMYPTPGRFLAVGEGDALGCFDPADEEIAVDAGPTVHWSDFAIEILPNPEAIDTTSEPERAWLAADLLWGTRRVPSVGGELWHDVGNVAPHGPAHNPEERWGRAAHVTDTRPYSPRPRPFAAKDIAWTPLAVFADAFTGLAASEPGDLAHWSVGLGSWTIAGGKLVATGAAGTSRDHGAAIDIAWPPTWYALPFATWNARPLRFGADLALDAPLPEGAFAGLALAGSPRGSAAPGQLRVGIREPSGPAPPALEVRWLTASGDSLIASAPIPAPGIASHRIEALALDSPAIPGLFLDVWYDSVLALGSVLAPGAREERRGLIVDRGARVRFDRVTAAGMRLEPAFHHPPFAAFTSAPAAGAEIHACPQLLTWVAVDEKQAPGIAAQEIALSTDAGVKWSVVATLDGTPRSYTWLPPTVPAERPGRLRLRVTDLEGDVRAVMSSSFRLVPGPAPVVVLAPAGGEAWLRGSAQILRWDVGCRSPVDLALSTDGGATYPLAIATGVITPGSHAWTIPAHYPLSTRARVRLSGAGLAGTMSPGDFTLRWDGQVAGGDFEHPEPWTLRLEVETADGDAETGHGIGPPALTPPLAGAASLFAFARAGNSVGEDAGSSAIQLIAASEVMPIGPGEAPALSFHLHALARVPQSAPGPCYALAAGTLHARHLDAGGVTLLRTQLGSVTVTRHTAGTDEEEAVRTVPLPWAPAGTTGLQIDLELMASSAAATGGVVEAQAAADNVALTAVIQAPAAPGAVTQLPAAPALELGSSNPGSGPVELRLHLPAGGEAALAVYDAGGRIVDRILEGVIRPPGATRLRWTPAADLPSGCYFFRLTAPRGGEARAKWTLLR